MSLTWKKGLAFGCALLIMSMVLFVLADAQSTETVEDATFKRRTGQFLVFYIKKQEKVRLVSGRLSEDTIILDKTGREMTSNADLSGVWTLRLTGEVGEGQTEYIIEMRRTRGGD